MSSRAGKILSAANWRHALAEIAFIVVGVLIALAMNAWWQGRQDREREREYLLRLLADTRANERSFVATISRDSTVQQRLYRILQMFRSRMPLPPAESLSAWHRWGGATEFSSFTGTYEALLRTGDLRLLRSDSVRIAATELATRIEATRETFGINGQEMSSLAGRRTERLVMHHRTQAVDAPASDSSGADIAWFNDVDWAAYREDREAQAAAQMSIYVRNNNIARLRSLLVPTRAFRILLERELGDAAPPDSAATVR